MERHELSGDSCPRLFGGASLRYFALGKKQSGCARLDRWGQPVPTWLVGESSCNNLSLLAL